MYVHRLIEGGQNYCCSCQGLVWKIPDQLHEKLSLGLLGGIAIVRLDWELDEGVPATEMDNFWMSEMDNFWWSTLWSRWRADLPKSKGRACRGWSQQQSSRRTEPYEYLVIISWTTDTSQQDGQFYPCFMNVIFTSGVMRSSRMTVSNNFVNSFLLKTVSRPPKAGSLRSCIRCNRNI